RGIVGIAVLADPRGACEEVAVALHVEERHLADHRAEELRALHHDRAHEEPAVAPAHDAEVAGRSDAAPDRILGDRDEVVERALVPLALRRMVPRRPELAAAAQ